jgi:hypothetical protein
MLQEFSLTVPSLAVAAEGLFLKEGFDDLSVGSQVAVVVWRFW